EGGEWCAWFVFGEGAPPMKRAIRRFTPAICLGLGTGALLGVRGSLTLDVGVGRRLRPLGPIRVGITAPRETVFDTIAGPYLSRTPRAMQQKLQVLERGTDMVLAPHFPSPHLGTPTPV